MTSEERLQKRVKSLERKVAKTELALYWSEQEQTCVRHWAEEAWAEVRRLHDMCTRHYEEMVRVRDGRQS